MLGFIICIILLIICLIAGTVLFAQSKLETTTTKRTLSFILFALAVLFFIGTAACGWQRYESETISSIYSY